jgi:hypothetical protein
VAETISATTARAGSDDDAAPRTVVVGLEAEPEYAELAEEIAEDLPDDLSERFPGFEWRVEVSEIPPKDPAANSTDFVRAARQRMLDAGWDLVVCLTALPLRVRRHPVTAHVDPTHGVGLISVPALGALDLERRAREAVVDLIAGLVGVRVEGDAEDGDRERVRDRLQELAAPLGTAQVRDDGRIRFTNAVVRGNLRLLVGMVRANQPTRVIMRLSRALVAALGTAAYVLASAGYWTLESHMSWPRLLGLVVVALIATSVALIVAHDLWERASTPDERERIALFNTVTTLTIVIGVVSLFLILFAVAAVTASALIPPSAFEKETGIDPGFVDYLRFGLFASAVATLASALGSMVESDLAVREAAYGYRPQPDENDDSGEGEGGRWG